ncbi:MAG: ion channel [Desulfomonilaceae bacterium]|nr:ion channel [Desulfomonilaceae bacterium]
MELHRKYPVLGGTVTRKYLAVLAVLLGLLIFHPLLPGSVAHAVLLGAIIVSAWLVKDQSPHSMGTILVLAVPAVILIALDLWRPAYLLSFAREPLGLAMTLFSLALLVFCGVFILKALIASSEVSSAEILGTVNFFIILGFIWAFVFSTLNMFQPDSFNVESTGRRFESTLLYFSFVTLTTLGYGDIVPLSHTAQMLTVIEAMVGQFYVAVVVAYLVSRYIKTRRVD